MLPSFFLLFFQAEDGIRDYKVTGVQTCALPIYRMAWVGFAESDPEKSVRPIAYAGFEDGYVQNIHVTWSEDESGYGPVGMAIRTLQPCPVQNIAANPLFAPWRQAATKRGYASVCGLPLITNGQPLGAIGIYSAS